MSIKDGIVLRFCRGHSCGKHVKELEAAARRYIEANGLDDVVGIADQSCYGKCFMGPNILVERWSGGTRNEKAMLSLMMGVDHPDMRYEHGTMVDDLPKLIRWHLRQWRRDVLGE